MAKRRRRDQRVDWSAEQRVAQRANASALEFGRLQLLASALDQRRMAERDRKDHDLARRQASAAAELALRRQGRFRDADPRPRRGKSPAAPWDEGLFRASVASG